MPPNIREAQPSDAHAIAEVLVDTGFTQVCAEPEPLTRQRLRETIEQEKHDPRHSILVAEGESGVTGFIAVNWLESMRYGSEGHISDLFIHSDCRGNGAGTELVEAAKKEARERSCQRLLLLNGKGGESYERGFYPKRGWEEHEEMACFMLHLPPESLATEKQS